MKKGQSLVEYVLVFCALAVIVTALCGLVGRTGRSVRRAEALVASDYP